MKSNWIQSYKVEKQEGVTIITGDFAASDGSFEIEYTGDGGNSDTYKITLSGGQYDIGFRRPITFTITGAWEIREVIDMFKLLDNLPY
jgi:hypothetical protein